jgi:hypothetical protein
MRIKDIRIEQDSHLCYLILEIEYKEDMKMLDGLGIGDTITQIQGVAREKPSMVSFYLWLIL